MKKILSVMLSLVLVFVGIAPALTNVTVKAENPNLITDGDFEKNEALKAAVENA